MVGGTKNESHCWSQKEGCQGWRRGHGSGWLSVNPGGRNCIVRRWEYGAWALRQVGEGGEALLLAAMCMKREMSAMKSVERFVEELMAYC